MNNTSRNDDHTTNNMHVKKRGIKRARKTRHRTRTLRTIQKKQEHDQQRPSRDKMPFSISLANLTYLLTPISIV